nr:MAG TPA: hypothetical protein [Caudoviricetes sp.]
MAEFSQDNEHRPSYRTGLVYEIAEYLAACGVCAPPDTNQRAVGETPAVFAYRLEDEPDRALAVFNLTVDEDVSESNPVVRFSLIFRGAPRDQLTPLEDAARAYKHLHDLTDVKLTATSGFLSCRRVINDPPLLDTNDRWHAVDTYTATLLAPPTTI